MSRARSYCIGDRVRAIYRPREALSRLRQIVAGALGTIEGISGREIGARKLLVVFDRYPDYYCTCYEHEIVVVVLEEPCI